MVVEQWWISISTFEKEILGAFNSLLTTKKTLIFRIRDPSDSEAWERFVEIYGPLVYRFGRRKGLQDADATDLSQTVLTEVAQCIDRFQYDASVGRFRNWLMVIARYKLSRLVKKQSRHTGSGDTRVLAMLDAQPADDEFERHWNAEYQDHLFRWAAEQVKQEVEERTWRAFWLTAVENKSPSEVAAELGVSISRIYLAKSRVLLRIRRKVLAVDESARMPE